MSNAAAVENNILDWISRGTVVTFLRCGCEFQKWSRQINIFEILLTKNY